MNLKRPEDVSAGGHYDDDGAKLHAALERGRVEVSQLLARSVELECISCARLTPPPFAISFGDYDNGQRLQMPGLESGTAP